MDAGRELEGWKEIGKALGVSERQARRLGRGATGLTPIPTYTNLRGFRAILFGDLVQWLAGARVELLEHEGHTPAAPPVTTHAA